MDSMIEAFDGFHLWARGSSVPGKHQTSDLFQHLFALFLVVNLHLADSLREP